MSVNKHEIVYETQAAKDDGTPPPGMPTATSVSPAPPPPMLQGTIQPIGDTRDFLLRGESFWHTGLTPHDGHEPPSAEYAIYPKHSTFDVYMVTHARCQLCMVVQPFENFSESGKRRIVRRAREAFANNGCYEASRKCICCAECVGIDKRKWAETQLTSMVAKKIAKAKVTISVEAVSSKTGRNIEVHESFDIGEGVEQADVSQIVFNKVVRKLDTEKND